MPAETAPTQPATEEHNLSPYSERSGSKAAEYAAVLYADPEIDLDENDKTQVREFAEDLFDGTAIEGIECDAGASLEVIYQTSPLEAAQTFYLGYFDTPEAQSDLEALGIKPGDDLEGKLFDISAIKDALEPKARKKIAANSLNWYKDQLAAKLLENPTDDQDFEEFKKINVNYEPERLIKKLGQFRDYRSFYRAVRGVVKEQSSTDVGKAKSVILNMHRARVNSLMAANYSGAMNLANQLNRQPESEEYKALSKALGEAVPALAATFMQEREDRAFQLDELGDGFARRLDFIRNGAAWSGVGDFTPISPELSSLAEKLTAEADSQPQTTPNNELIEKMESVKFDAETFKGLATKVIGNWELLSSEESSWTDVEARNGFSADGKWQIIISPKVKGMSVNGAKRVFVIPESYSRTLMQESPAGVLPGLAHELTHLLQCEFDYKLAEQVPLARIQGRRTSSIREAGTIYQEREVQAMVGRNRPVNIHYLKALTAKLGGANRMAVARTFYESLIEGKDLTPEKGLEARNQAVDRTERFYGMGGHNSYPLDYIQQELILRGLDELTEERKEALLVAAASFDLQDTANLRRHGLIELPTELATHPAKAVWDTFQEHYAADLSS